MADEISTIRGKPKFQWNGYLYVFDQTNVGKTVNFWRCERRGICKARLHERISDNTVIRELGIHTHDEDPGRVEAAKVITKAKKRAYDTLEPTSTVISECTQNIAPCVGASLPKLRHFKRTIQRVRKKNDAAPHTPKSLEELIIPPEFSQYSPSDGVVEPFLQYDSGPEADRILIFGRKSVLEIMESARFWFGDGTFSVTPPLFYQVYVLLFEHQGTVYPAAYALLPNKTSATYRKMFHAIKNVIPSAQPEYFSCDFELAAINTFKEAFPATTIAGCLYHLASNIKKKVAAVGLQAPFRNDPEFNLQVRLITALAFVPPADVLHAFDTIQVNDTLEPVYDYFEDNYLGRPSRRTRRVAPFPVQIWNVHDRTLNGDPRTNNHAEAAHRRLQQELSMAHPTIWRFIAALKKVQKGRDLFFEQVSSSFPLPQKRQKYVDRDIRLLNIVVQYKKENMLPYLRSVAYNLKN